jgi:transcriptional regulator with XRE-family HTH domain
VTPSGSPTVRRRRLAAELRRLRGARTGGVVANALGWSPAKISRYELGQSSFPLDEVERLLDFYGVTDLRRTQLLALAADANERGWWQDYADVLPAGYMEYIGLEAEAASVAEWQTESVPGLLQTEDYAREIIDAYQSVARIPPRHVERRSQVRIIRQRVLTERDPPLELSAAIDESVLLRKVGSRELMVRQLRHLVEMAELPNIDLRVLPLQSETSLVAAPFIVLGFSELHEDAAVGDVVSIESPNNELYIGGEADTYMYRLMFQAFFEAALPSEQSRDLILQTARRVWGGNSKTG